MGLQGLKIEKLEKEEAERDNEDRNNENKLIYKWTDSALFQYYHKWVLGINVSRGRQKKKQAFGRYY